MADTGRYEAAAFSGDVEECAVGQAAPLAVICQACAVCVWGGGGSGLVGGGRGGLPVK